MALEDDTERAPTRPNIPISFRRSDVFIPRVQLGGCGHIHSILNCCLQLLLLLLFPLPTLPPFIGLLALLFEDLQSLFCFSSCYFAPLSKEWIIKSQERRKRHVPRGPTRERANQQRSLLLLVVVVVIIIENDVSGGKALAEKEALEGISRLAEQAPKRRRRRTIVCTWWWDANRSLASFCRVPKMVPSFSSPFTTDNSTPEEKV